MKKNEKIAIIASVSIAALGIAGYLIYNKRMSLNSETDFTVEKDGKILDCKLILKSSAINKFDVGLMVNNKTLFQRTLNQNDFNTKNKIDSGKGEVITSRTGKVLSARLVIDGVSKGEVSLKII